MAVGYLMRSDLNETLVKLYLFVLGAKFREWFRGRLIYRYCSTCSTDNFKTKSAVLRRAVVDSTAGAKGLQSVLILLMLLLGPCSRSFF